MKINVEEAWKEKIRQKAEALYNEAGRPENPGDHFWLMAEKMLLERYDGLCGCLKHPIRLGHPDVVKWRHYWWFIGCLSEVYEKSCHDG